MYVKYKDIRPGDRFFLKSKDEEGWGTLPAQLGPDDDVVLDRWYGFPPEPHLRQYLDWMERELTECAVAVRKLREVPDSYGVAETGLKERLESLRRLIDRVEFPVIRNALTGLR